jgi:ankyrin repeat protein
LWIAAAANLLDTAKFLFQNSLAAGPEMTVATYYGHVPMVRLLGENGCDVNAPEKFFGSALQAAVHLQNAELVRVLLEMGADPNRCQDNYASALATAACQGDVNIVRQLLATGADVNLHDGVHDYPLLAVRSSGRENIAQLLIQNGANIYVVPTMRDPGPDAPVPITWAPKRRSHWTQGEAIGPIPFPFRKDVAPITPPRLREFGALPEVLL